MSSPAVPRAVMRVASRKFCAAVRTLHTPQTIAQEMTLTGMQLILPIDPSGPVRISDERIGEEPACYWKLSGTLEPDLWIWNPDLLRGDNLIPIYRLQGGRS
jgi:hypothetical protein